MRNISRVLSLVVAAQFCFSFSIDAFGENGATAPVNFSSSLINFHQVNDELYRSGTLSQAAIVELSEKGIRSIISLEDYGGDQGRAEAEATWARNLGISHVWYAMSPTRKPTLRQVRGVLKLIEDADKPVLIHCKRGSDRTGIAVAAYRISKQGWSVDQAIRELRRREYGHFRHLYFWDEVLYDVAGR